MKGILIFVSFLLLTHFVIAQNKDSIIKDIDKSVLQIESTAKAFKTVQIDSSRYKSPYRDIFFIDPVSNKLSKVEFILTNPDVKISYYFINSNFIKALAIDKSTGGTFIIHSYFKQGKLIYQSHRGEHSDKGQWMITNANDYLTQFQKYIISN